MWWITGIAIGIAAVATALLLRPWAEQYRPGGTAASQDPLELRYMLRSTPWASAVTAVLDATALLIAFVNFALANRMSWGLAANWAFGITIAAGVVGCVYRGWGHFLTPDWKVFRRSFLVTIPVIWTVLVIVVALTPARSANDESGLLLGVMAATAVAPIWIPFVGVPVGVFAGFIAAVLTRRREGRRRLVTA